MSNLINYNTQDIINDANDINNINEDNDINFNYVKNVKSFSNNNSIRNKAFFPYKGKKQKILKHKICSNIDCIETNREKYINNFSDKDSCDSISIDDLINKVNYTGDKNNFPKYIEELKLKADITNIVQNMFKNEINSFNGLEQFFENSLLDKNKKILNMYKFLLNRLIQKNSKKLTDKELENIYKEIYSC